MRNKLDIIFKTKTLYHSIVSSSFTLVNGVLGIVFYAIVARLLGPSDFGVFAIATATLAMLASIANVGTDTGIVKFVAKYIRTDNPKALRFLKLGLEMKIAVGLILAVVGWFAAAFLVNQVFHKPELLSPIRIAVVGASLMLLFSFATSALQSIQRFFIWGTLNVSLNASRIIAVLILSASSALNVISGIVVFALMPLVGFFIALGFLPNFFKVRNETSISREFFNYNKWVAVFVVIAAIAARLDTYISAKFLSLSEVGIYAVATGLTSIVPQLVSAIATVVAPKLSQINSSKEAKKYLSQVQLLVLGLAIPGLIAGGIGGAIFIPIAYGQQYLQSIIPFLILLAAQAIFLISIPAHTSVIYYFSYPKLFVWISLGNLLIVSLLGIYLITNFGIIGAAFTVLIGNIFNFIVPAIWSFNKLNR